MVASVLGLCYAAKKNSYDAVYLYKRQVWNAMRLK